MMDIFLRKFATELVKNHGENLGEIDVVLPNRRAGLYIGKYISEIFDKPVWSPNFISIEDFIYGQIDYSKATTTELLFELFKAYKQFDENRNQDFDDFLRWGLILLSDINEVDSSLAFSNDVFGYLKDTKRLQEWNLDINNAQKLSSNYLKFYSNINSYYTIFRANLVQLKIAYYGMACRMLAENELLIKSSDRPLYFVGFSTLTQSEKVVFNQCKKIRKAKFYWDIDSYYFDDKSQEAGDYLREHFANTERKDISWISNSWLQNPKEIISVGVAGNMLQVKYVADLLKKLVPKFGNSPNECAVVLADETLAIPLLNSLPNCGLSFNFTMTYPLGSSMVYDFILLLIDFANYSKSSKNTSKPVFYFVLFEKILTHTLVQSFNTESNSFIHKTITEIKAQNKAYCSMDFLLKKFESSGNKLVKELLMNFDYYLGTTKSLIEIVNKIFDFINSNSMEFSSMIRIFIFESRKILSEIDASIQHYQVQLSINNFKKLVKTFFHSAGVPFNGEPLAGVQIMGALETRLLDFKTVIFVSANEGILPKPETYQSFLPFDLRRAFNLPLPKSKTKTSAYHFYRLLQRAETVYLLNNSVSDSMGASEESQFTRQIEYEAPIKNPKIKFSKEEFSLMVGDTGDALTAIQSVEFAKDKDTMDRLNEINSKGFSPSSISTYLECSLKYYFSKIINIQEEELLEESIEMRTMGNVIHHCLENLYINHLNIDIDVKLVTSMLEKMPEQLKESFKIVYLEGDINSGTNFLSYTLAENFLIRFFNAEIMRIKEKHIKIKVLGLEKEIGHSLLINSQKINFFGKIDRINLEDDDVVIWDYKTGTFGPVDIKIKTSSFSQQALMSKKNKSFQLLMYAWMYAKTNSLEKLKTGIVSLKNQSVFNTMQIDNLELIDNESLQMFESLLMNIMSEMLNPELKFAQTSIIKNCENCQYKSICSRG